MTSQPGSLLATEKRELTADMQVGPLGYGCWRLVAMSPHYAQARIEMALDHGMNLIDTADVYGLDWGGAGFGDAEALLGQVLAQSPTLRDRMVLASKGGIIPGVPYDSGALEQACEASLQRLGVERIDLYQIHRPDLLAHPADVAAILETLRASGKIGEVGVSNFRPSQVDALQAHLSFPLVTHQPEYSALHLDPLFDGTFDQCMQYGMGVIVWSPLAGGRLGNADQIDSELASVLQGLAEREGTDISTIAMAFALAHPAQPIALVGSTNLQRIEAATAALRVQLDRADVYAIIQASMGESLP